MTLYELDRAIEKARIRYVSTIDDGSGRSQALKQEYEELLAQRPPEPVEDPTEYFGEDFCTCDLCDCFGQGECERHAKHCQHCNNGGVSSSMECPWLASI